ncbi:STAS domain-containing protein [Streptomyces sp. NPDC058401]|uniref:STAS domain-containing protein n=1 Tax=Streptomyces sp. NPDC058401 TaxID=3346480 RepID=UPI0036537880
MEDRERPEQDVWIDGDARRCVVHVRGEMDLDRGPMLRHALHTAITRPGGPPEIVIDLSDLSFCDSSGLNILISARQTATDHDRRISLRNPQSQILRLLEIAGVGTLFPVTDA